MYCGRRIPFRAHCDVAQLMGYKNVFSLAGGHKAMANANWPMTKEK